MLGSLVVEICIAKKMIKLIAEKYLDKEKGFPVRGCNALSFYPQATRHGKRFSSEEIAYSA